MLTDDEKARIRAEEEFRTELRRQFAEPKPNRWWVLLNSAFGLWLLGSVTLTGLAFLYQKLEVSYRAAVERAETQRKVREELGVRFDVARYYLQLSGVASCAEKDQPTPEFTGLILKAANGDDSGAYEEFRRVSATTLFSQLFHLANTLDYQKLPEQEVKQFVARKDWIFLEPKLRVRVTRPQSTSQLTCTELGNRLGRIADTFR